jgi:hypothetical protein
MRSGELQEHESRHASEIATRRRDRAVDLAPPPTVRPRRCSAFDA